FPSGALKSTRWRRHVPVMLRCRRLLVARLASGASLGLRTALAAEDPCAVKLFRWQEGCRNLRGRAAALGARPGELCRTRPSSRWRGSGWRAEASARARDRAGPIAAYSVSGSPGGAISMATVIGWLEHVGVTLVFLFVLLEQAGLPLPAYPLLIIAGAWSALGGFRLYALIAATLWAGAGIALGVIFHDAVDSVFAELAALGRLGAILILGIFAAFLTLKWWRRHQFFHELRMSRISVGELARL